MSVTSRHEANSAAQRAFRRMLEHHLRSGVWSPILVADWTNAEHAFDEAPEFLLSECCGANPGGPHWVHCSERAVS